MIKQNKGITLVSLVVTIVILLILTGTIIYDYTLSNNTLYNKMVSDIELINDKILIYYNKYSEIPKTDRKISIKGIDYYEIDLSKLGELTLNYGNEFGEQVTLSNSSNVYVTDMNLNVYYLKGVEKSGQIYHVK